MTDDTYAITIDQLSKIYAATDRKKAPHQALDSVSFNVPKGSIFGLLGPNGAGKSTLINIIAGLVTKTSGSVHIAGFNIDTHERHAKASVGIVPQEINFDAFFNPRDTLELQAGLYGVPKHQRITDEILDLIGLMDKADAYVRTLSGGMKRRLMIGKAMVHRPPILILDEPTAGVDIELRRQLWRNVKRLNDLGVTIILTTHYLEEAEELCDHIAIINHGKIITCRPKEDLLSQIDSKELVIRCSVPFDTLPDQIAVLGAEKKGQRSISFNFSPKDTPAGILIDAVLSAGFEIADITTHDSKLEDIFIDLTTAVAA